MTNRREVQLGFGRSLPTLKGKAEVRGTLGPGVRCLQSEPCESGFLMRNHPEHRFWMRNHPERCRLAHGSRALFPPKHAATNFQRTRFESPITASDSKADSEWLQPRTDGACAVQGSGATPWNRPETEARVIKGGRPLLDAP